MGMVVEGRDKQSKIGLSRSLRSLRTQGSIKQNITKRSVDSSFHGLKRRWTPAPAEVLIFGRQTEEVLIVATLDINLGEMKLSILVEIYTTQLTFCPFPVVCLVMV